MNRRILWLLLALLLLAAIFIARIWLWKTSVVLEAEVPFTAVFRAAKEISGTSFSCPEASCTFRLRPGSYELQLTADGYFPEAQEVRLSWRGPNEFQIDLQKVPVLRPLTEEPTAWKDYENEQAQLAGQFHFDTAGKLLRRNGSENVLVAEYPPETVPELRIFPENHERIFVLSPRQIYEVDVTGRRKFLIFTVLEEEVLTDLRVFPGNTLLVKSKSPTAERTFFFFPADRTTRSFPENISFDLLCQQPQNESVLFFLAREQQWLLKKFDLEKNEVSGVAGYDFAEVPERIMCAEENAVLIKTAAGKFYELDFS